MKRQRIKPHSDTGNSFQLPLDWTAAGSQTLPPSGVLPTQPVIPKRSLRETVERFLRDNGVPYISVDEAKKVLFSGGRLRSFHFVVYRNSGQNWLLYAAGLRRESREDLVQWESVFGPGFVAIVASQDKDGTLRFRRLTGEPATLDQ